MIAKIRYGLYKKKRSHRKKTVETLRMNDIEKKKNRDIQQPWNILLQERKEIDQKGKLNREIQRLKKEGAGLKISVKLPIT